MSLMNNKLILKCKFNSADEEYQIEYGNYIILFYSLLDLICIPTRNDTVKHIFFS